MKLFLLFLNLRYFIIQNNENNVQLNLYSFCIKLFNLSSFITYLVFLKFVLSKNGLKHKDSISTYSVKNREMTNIISNSIFTVLLFYLLYSELKFF